MLVIPASAIRRRDGNARVLGLAASSSGNRSRPLKAKPTGDNSRHIHDKSDEEATTLKQPTPAEVGSPTPCPAAHHLQMPAPPCDELDRKSGQSGVERMK